MDTSKVISTDKATVVIQVNPQVAPNTVIGDDGQEVRGAYHNTALAEFFKAQPKALGTIQIMIGVVCFLFGIIHTASNNKYNYQAILVYSGITYWGSLIYISAGSLSVAAQNKLHLCMVKASLVMNGFSAITACIAIVLISIEIGYFSFQNLMHHNPWRCILGINGILLVLSILQLIISICISRFACKATSNSDSANQDTETQ